MTNKQRCRKCIHKVVCPYKDYFAEVDYLGEKCSKYKPKPKKDKEYPNIITRLTIDFYPTEKELVEQIEKQPKMDTYIKDLIRKDIEREETRQAILPIIAKELHVPLEWLQ